MLSPRIVGQIAAQQPTFLAGIGVDDARALIRHDLAHAAVTAADAAAIVIDPQADARLRKAAHSQAVRSVAVAGTATRVAQVLRDGGVDALVYKGPALAVRSTGGWVGRGSADIDVLVASRQLIRSDELLRAIGCHARAGYSTGPTKWEQYHRPERAYVGLPVTIDLHWRVDPGPGYFTLAFADLWARRQRVECDGLDVETLDDVDALLVTAVHGAKELWWRWFWVLDAVRQIEMLEPASWSATRERAEASGSLRALELCLAVSVQAGGRSPQGFTPSPRLLRTAAAWLTASADAGAATWSVRASLARRWARWGTADSWSAAAGGFARAVARLAADRRAPGAPQVGRP